MDVQQLDQGNRAKTIRTAGTARTGAGSVRGARLRRLIRLDRPARAVVTAMRNMRGVRPVAPGPGGQCRRQRRKYHAHGQQERQGTFKEIGVKHASNFNRYRFRQKCPRYDRGPAPEIPAVERRWTRQPAGIFTSEPFSILFRRLSQPAARSHPHAPAESFRSAS